MAAGVDVKVCNRRRRRCGWRSFQNFLGLEGGSGYRCTISDCFGTMSNICGNAEGSSVMDIFYSCLIEKKTV